MDGNNEVHDITPISGLSGRAAFFVITVVLTVLLYCGV